MNNGFNYLTLFVFACRLQWKQKKYALASSQYDKLLKLMEDRYGDDSILLIPVYQECGKISFDL